MPQAFGLSGTTVSRQYIGAGAKQLRDLSKRRLEECRFVVLILEGKKFGPE